ncbi:MAG: HlyC/CorC family transporter [Bacilli bacterium]|nr:HlyC/CorC family transporter [Bacilli bacterium]
MDSIPEWLSILLILLLVIFSAFFNASETSFACLNRYKFMAEAESGKKTAKLILKLCDRYESTLITTLTGNNIVSILLSTISTFLFLNLFHGIIPDATVSLIASLVMAFVLFLFGDTLPKYLGKNMPDSLARINVYPLYFFYIVFYPFTFIFRSFSAFLQKLFKAKPDVPLTEEDLKSIIDEAEEKGVFEENESEIIQKALDFADTSVKEVFTPREKMALLNLEGLKTEGLLEYLQKCPYSRIPVYIKNPNKIAGVLVVKNYLNAYFRNPSVKYTEFIQRAYFVTPKVTLDDLLDGFKGHHTQIAIVRYEGKLLGMVTMEDVLEELVGNIDENNRRRRGRA